MHFAVSCDSGDSETVTSYASHSIVIEWYSKSAIDLIIFSFASLASFGIWDSASVPKPNLNEVVQWISVVQMLYENFGDHIFLWVDPWMKQSSPDGFVTCSLVDSSVDENDGTFRENVFDWTTHTTLHRCSPLWSFTSLRVLTDSYFALHKHIAIFFPSISLIWKILGISELNPGLPLRLLSTCLGVVVLRAYGQFD